MMETMYYILGLVFIIIWLLLIQLKDNFKTLKRENKRLSDDVIKLDKMLFKFNSEKLGYYFDIENKVIVYIKSKKTPLERYREIQVLLDNFMWIENPLERVSDDLIVEINGWIWVEKKNKI